MQFPNIRNAFSNLVQSLKTVLTSLLVPIQVFLSVLWSAGCCALYMIVRPIWEIADRHIPNSGLTSVLNKLRLKLETVVKPKGSDNI